MMYVGGGLELLVCAPPPEDCYPINHQYTGGALSMNDLTAAPRDRLDSKLMLPSC